MRILALITARGGSKRIPGKNIRPLGGKPLIVWSIDVAKNIAEIADILVSTDDKIISDVAKNAGAIIPWLRPLELATDTASSIDVCLHALEWYEKENGKVDGLMLLQPTSPFRSRESVLQGIDLFRNKLRPVIGVSVVKSHPMWCFKIDKGMMRPFMKSEELHMRHQDLPPAYTVNGAFYLVSPEYLREHRSFYKGDMMPLIIDAPEENMDIDTEWDWKLAEAIIKLQRTPK
jgi:CMP-N,N'-diacetyllegionaminic acid synthase